MLYRVVLKGHAAPGANVDDVKRHFMRVTALPSDVTEQLFDGTAKVLKRQLSEADAERIAQTLRAIGAPATVEPEPAASGFVPLGATTTISPGSTAAHATGGAKGKAAPAGTDGAPVARTLATASRRKAAVLAALAVAIGSVAAAPYYDEWVRRLRTEEPAARQAANAAVAADAVLPEPVAFRPASIEGRWRCTDQGTGVSTYWAYRSDGTLVHFGDNVTHGEEPVRGPDVPVRWSLEGDQLTWSFESRPARTLKLIELTLLRLAYADGPDAVTRCLRP